MFSKLNEKVKAALFLAIGMGLFLLAGSFVYYFPTHQRTGNGAISRANDSSSSIEDLYQNLSDRDSDNRASVVKEIEQYEIQGKQAEVDDRWVLYITGSVNNPGVYKLQPDARVFQLVEIAGGLTTTADVLAFNMAARLQDGDHLHVPRIEDNSSPMDSRNMPSGVAQRPSTAIQNRQRGDSVVNNKKSSKNPLNKSIDLNTATAAELQMLPGIGPAMSERIIQYRNQNGRFKSVHDLLNVSRIGAKVLESIEPFLFVR